MRTNEGGNAPERRGPVRSTTVDARRRAPGPEPGTSVAGRALVAALTVVAALGCDAAAGGTDGGPAIDAAVGADGAAGACGDGVRDDGEACDDGNATTGDGCTAGCRVETEPAGADTVVDAPGASGEGFGDPTKAVDGVRGGGLTTQSLDVYSIPRGEPLVLGWEDRVVVNGPGVDLVVFENAFHYGDGLTFMDPTVVEVSADGERWVAFPHDFTAADETSYSPRTEHWVGFAGVTPVLLHAEGNPVDPFDGAAAGGDGFDLADLPDEALRAAGIRYVRLTAATDHDNPDTGAPFVADPVSDGPDIDGVAARYLAEAP